MGDVVLDGLSAPSGEAGEEELLNEDQEEENDGAFDANAAAEEEAALQRERDKAANKPKWIPESERVDDPVQSIKINSSTQALNDPLNQVVIHITPLYDFQPIEDDGMVNIKEWVRENPLTREPIFKTPNQYNPFIDRTTAKKFTHQLMTATASTASPSLIYLMIGMYLSLVI